MDRDDTASGGGSPRRTEARPRITPDDVQRKEFGTARLRVGYLMHEVDEFLDQITDTLSALIAENERLRADLSAASAGRPATPRAAAPPTGSPDRTAVDAFLQREKAFLQSLGSLVQGHTTELKDMVRSARTSAPPASAPTPSGPSVPAAASTAPVAPAPPPPTSPAAPPSPDSTPGTDESVARADADDDVEVILDEDTRAIEVVEAEEPIRVDEPEPSSGRRPEETPEGSLRELFWGEE